MFSPAPRLEQRQMVTAGALDAVAELGRIGDLGLEQAAPVGLELSLGAEHGLLVRGPPG